MNKEDRGALLGALFAGKAGDNIPLNMIASDVAELRSAARSLERLAIEDCNYGLSDRQFKRRDRLVETVDAIAKTYDLSAHCSGDPRGLVVRLFSLTQPDTGDAFGGGWGVY